MGEATIRELRNKGGEVIERVLAGERVIITRDGEPVAELRPLPRRVQSTAALIDQLQRLPRVDPRAFRADIDALLDQSIE